MRNLLELCTMEKTFDKARFRKHLFWASLICLHISLILFLGIERSESPHPVKLVIGKIVIWSAFIIGWGGLILRRRDKSKNGRFPSLLDERVLPKKYQLFSFMASLVIGFGIALSFPEIFSYTVLAFASIWIAAGIFAFILSIYYFWAAIKSG